MYFLMLFRQNILINVKGVKTMGYIYAIVAGATMSIQGVMNTRLSEKTGLFASNAYVQLTAFVIAVIAMLVSGGVNLKAFGEVNKFYLFGGVLGFIITLTVMLSVKGLSPTVAISVILISQLICAALIDAFGLMDSEKVAFTWNKYAGALGMIASVALFKWKC